MSYIGQAALKNSELKRFDVTSSTSATHVLSWTAPNEQSLFITINGVKQQDDAYSIAGSPTTITLTDALVATDKMEVIGVIDIGVITIVGDNSVSTSSIAPNAVTATEIATDAVGTSEIAANAVDTAEIAANAVTLTELADGTQGGTLYYGAAGAPTQLAAGTSGQFLKTQGVGANPVWGTVDTSGIDANKEDIALLAFKTQANGNLARYNLVDQSVDAFEDASGVNTAASTYAVRDTTGKYYSGISDTISGGTETTFGLYTVHAFTTPGAGSLVVTASGNIDALLVAGGGGGGKVQNAGTAGGAGGLIYDPTFAVTSQTYAITVGSGGPGFAETPPGSTQQGPGTSGGNSTGFSMTAFGGGGGGGGTGPGVAGVAGGSGGGGGYGVGPGGASTQTNNGGGTGWGQAGGSGYPQ